MAEGAAVVDRDVLSVEGPDAEAYLQGQLSQDVSGLAIGASAWTFALQPQGKVDAWFRLTRLGDDRFLADIDAGHGDALLARLRRFLLRTEADLTPVRWRMAAVRGPVAGTVVVPAGTIAADPAWPGLEGVDLLGTDVEVPAGVPELSAEQLEELRIRVGVPRMGAELTEATIPAETGVVERSVSFTKGCFTGQELVARIDSRGGHVPRHLRRLEADAPMAVGAEVLVDGAAVGSVTSAADHVALAYVGRAVEPPADASVGGIPARVLALPT